MYNLKCIQIWVSLLMQSIFRNSLECIFYIDCFFSTCFKIRNVAFGLTPSHGPFLRYLMNNKKLLLNRKEPQSKIVSYANYANKIFIKVPLFLILPYRFCYPRQQMENFQG